MATLTTERHRAAVRRRTLKHAGNLCALVFLRDLQETSGDDVGLVFAKQVILSGGTREEIAEQTEAHVIVCWFTTVQLNSTYTQHPAILFAL